MRRIWRSSSTGTSRMLRIRSSLRKTWWWKILRKYWMWVRMTADHRVFKKSSKTKVRVYSDSVLCLGWMISSREEIKEKWTIQVRQFKMYFVAHDFYGFDGDAVEFEWKILPEQHYRSHSRFWHTYDVRTLNQNDSLTGSYLCQCSMNSVQVVEAQSSISTLRVVKDFDYGFSGNLKKIHCYVQHSQISMLCDLILWKRKGQDVRLLHHKFKSVRLIWRRW